MTAFNSAVALAVARLTQRLWNGLMLSGGLAVTLLPMFWLSRLSPGTSYLTGIELPMVLIGMGQAATPSHHLRPRASPVSAVTTHVPLQPLVKAPKHVREPGGAAVLLLAVAVGKTTQRSGASIGRGIPASEACQDRSVSGKTTVNWGRIWLTCPTVDRSM
jgi:hypothetical protein